MENNKKIFPVFLLLVFSSFLFSLSFPGIVFVKGCSLFAWFCFIPLFFAVDCLRLRYSFLWGMLYGALSYGLLVFWLYNYSFYVYLLAVGFYSILYGILFVLLKLSCLIFVKNHYLLQCLLLLSFEYLKTLGFFGFSYGIMGYTQWKTPVLIKLADITGVYGVSSLVIFCSGISYAGLRFLFMNLNLKKRIKFESHNTKYTPLKFEIEMSELKQKAGLRSFLISGGCFLFVLLIVFVYGKLSKIDYSDKREITVCSVQHNENPYEDGVTVYAENLTRLMELTDEALALYPETSLVVWPETAVTPSIMYQYFSGTDNRRKSLVNSLLKYMDKHSCDFVIGNYHAVPVKGTTLTDDYNSALHFVPGKNVFPPSPEMYFKQHLVPMSEEFPFENSFLFVKDYMENLGANFWCKGKQNEKFEKDGLVFSTPICFEDTFPDLCRKMVKEGGRCFINLTNDSWSKSEACQWQHLSMAVFRSVENHIPTVRSATSGITCIISPNGKVLKESPVFSPSSITGKIPVFDSDMHLSFYSRHGDFYSFLIICLTGVLLIIGVIRGIIKIWQIR